VEAGYRQEGQFSHYLVPETRSLMKKVCLKFDTIFRLFEFIDVAAITKYQLDRIRNVVTVELNNADIELAEKAYRAKVIQMKTA
jgi:hypothetical protein